MNRLIYKGLNMDRTSARELSGVSMGLEGQAFSNQIIDRFILSQPINWEHLDRPKHIGVFVDPNAGGSSLMAIVSVCLHQGRLIVCGIDGHAVANDDDQQVLLYTHVKNLLQHKWLSDAYVTLFTERGTGHASGHLAKMLITNFWKVSAYHQPDAGIERKTLVGINSGEITMREFEQKYELMKTRNPGFRTDVTTKNEFRVACHEMLSLHSIFWLKDCICMNPFMRNKTYQQRFAQTKETLYDQMRRAIVVARRPKNELQQARVTWSGKANEDGDRQDGYEDDLILILAAACYYWPKAMMMQLPGFPYSQTGFYGENKKIATETRRHYVNDRPYLEKNILNLDSLK